MTAAGADRCTAEQHIDRRHIVLVGMMGAGKSSVGRVLAARLDRPLLDTDELVEASTGRSVREIWVTSVSAGQARPGPGAVVMRRRSRGSWRRAIVMRMSAGAMPWTMAR